LLRRRADLSALSFVTTADLEPIEGLGVQPRVAEALAIGGGATARGFNIFAIGPSVARIKEALGGPLRSAAQGRPAPDDWVYVNNFATPHRPRALRLPAGRGPALQKALQTMVDDLRAGLPAMFESEDHQRRRSAIEATFHGRAEQAFSALGEKASGRGVAILRTPMGFAVAPRRDGRVVQPEEFAKWTEAEREAARAAMSEVERELEETLRSIPRLEKERREAVRALEKETARLVVDQEIAEAVAAFADLPEVVAHFDAVRADIVDNLHLFLAAAAAEGEEAAILPPEIRPHDRYEANVLVTRQPGEEGAPVVEELNPTLGNLVGRIEYLSRQGALVTNFRLIKPGALHRANGGILLIDARSLLMEPFSWAALKRALLTGQIAIEDAHRFLGLATTVSLEPDPIPLDVKVVLFGDRLLYYLLAEYDPDMAKHFKVLADFDEVMDRSPENEALLARLVAGILQRDGAAPLDRAATASLLEHAARLASDSGRLSLLVEHLRDIAIEAGDRARAAGRSIVGEADVGATIRARRRRAGRIRDRLREATLDGVLLVDTEGRRTGRVNGLSVMELGGEAFGRPSRITARARPGQGEIIDIEREVELGGPIHSKGVLILSGYLAGHYAPDFPLSLHASLVFEQSYGGVEGDSASCAELCALLSEIGEIPLRQDLAITGSVNQQGEVQAIGGVNEKIEGFFEICAARGLTGTQGVIIPSANVRHLMLDPEVVQACAEGRFAVHAVSTVDEAMALLSGLEAGRRGRGGAFPEGSVNRAVESRLRRFAELRRRWGAGEDGRRGRHAS
jgi:lon-related putative ATP-dependent protease